MHALIGKEANKRRAETLLANAITAGYTPKSLDNDSDLESIRDSEAYRTIARFIETSRRDRRLSPATSDDQSMPNEFQPL